MPLPKIDHPLFDATLPSGKKVKYRPFTVKEEKVLLLAKEGNDAKSAFGATQQIVNNCVVGDVQADRLPLFDIEYLFLLIRAKSVGSKVKLRIRHDEKTTVDTEVDLNQINVRQPAKPHKGVVQLNKSVGIKLRHPTITTLMERDLKDIYDVLADCIDKVFEGDEVYDLKDFKKEEVDEFISGFTTEHMEQIKQFFDSAPTIEITAKYRTKDGGEHTKTISGLGDFLGSA